ncbi:MAG: hypothetical protein VYB50_06860 [Candidatus Thermoplasmatota archaeon]|nr:hypothetical protein [Candidatus Thermoplasmatota archaeon]
MSRIIPVFLMVILLGASYSQMSWVEPEMEISGEFDDIHSVELTPEQKTALSSSGFTRGSNTNWTQVAGGAGDDTIFEMMEDSQGDLVICGRVENATQLGSILLEVYGNGDILIAKLSGSGVWKWATVVGSPAFVDACRGIDVAANDTIYATGYIREQMEFGNVSVLVNPGWDGWIGAISPAGEWEWVRTFGGDDIDVGWDVAVDSKGNLAVTGFFQNTSFFGGAGAVTALSQGNVYRYFLTYFNVTQQEFVWVKTTRGYGYSTAFQVVVDHTDDGIYTAGYNNGNEDYAFNNSSNPSGTWAAVVAKYSTNGTLKWIHSVDSSACGLGSNCGAYFNNIIVHPFGGIVAGGQFLQDYRINGVVQAASQGVWDVFVMRISVDGKVIWNSHGGSSGDDRVESLSVNPKGQIQVGGWHERDIRFGYHLANRTSNSYDDFYIAQLSHTGTWQWAFSNGGGFTDSVGGLLALSDGSIVAAGDFSGLVILDSGNTLYSSGDGDMFVWKFFHDADDDDVGDYWDNCINVPNLNQTDYENDELGDACDPDDDNDGLHDVLDDCNQGFIGWNQTDPTLDHDADGCHDEEEDLDDDADGVLDVDDLCPKGINNWTSTYELDMDGDGCQDETEDVDDDADGVLDVDDNCPIISTSNQADYDGDLFGDVCDLDDDGDDVDDIDDQCPMNEKNWSSNSLTDADGDGCQDASEDLDDDNDLVEDVNESGECNPGQTNWAATSETDLDGDGCRDADEDTDDDGDMVLDSLDSCPRGMTNWVQSSQTDNDFDGCHDDEDDDDDNDGTLDVRDDCQFEAGNASRGGKVGCVDTDGDGWADESEPPLFVQNPTQWKDADSDGYGDNIDGTFPDACPFTPGNSSINFLGCPDADGDGYADPTLEMNVQDGADGVKDDPTQWEDADGDGFGDNFEGNEPDRCPDEYGTSTIDRFGCKDTDKDGYSDLDGAWSYARWELYGVGPDYFKADPTQWSDSDDDGYGDNWGDESLNETRDPEWPGIWVKDARNVDMCPTESAEGKINDAFPGCPLGFVVDEPSDDTKDTVDQAAGTSDGVSTNAIIGIVGGVVVLALVGVIVMLLRKPKSRDNDWEKEPTDFNLPSPSEVLEKEDAGPSPSLEALPGITSSHTENTPHAVANSAQATMANKVDSWESLPPGNYLDPDENGTLWYKDAEGNHWYQNTDESWTKWQS